MDEVTETIAYSVFVHPVRRGLRWLALYFAITLPLAALIFRRNLEDFILVASVIVFPGSLLPFVSPWSRARELAKQFKTVAVARRSVSVDGETHDLSQCRWFRGFAFHDPKLADYPASSPAVVITWPPFGGHDRTICGLTADTKERIVAQLGDEAIPEDKPRRINERFLLNAVTLGTATLVISLLAAVNLLAVPGIPFASILVSAAVGGIAARIWLKHRFGHIQFQETSSRTFAAWATVIVVGTLKTNRRGGGGPLHQNASFLTWVLPLALIQGIGLYALYRYVRAREDALLVDHSQHTKRHA